MLASTLPDFGSPGTPMFVSAVASFLWTLYAMRHGRKQDEILWAAFIGGFIGFGIAFFLYGFGLATGLY